MLAELTVLLPLLFFVLALFYFAASNGWRAAFLKASIVWGLAVVASTEALSPFDALSAPALTAAWLIACIAAGVGVWRSRALVRAQFPLLIGEMARERGLSWLSVSPIAAIVAATGVIAWVAPPNTYDSMAYHMARVAHWAADGTVAHYPTNILRQLYSSPWSEFAVLHLQVLSGGDHLANLVQWCSMIGCIAGASLIAQQLGSPLRGQVLAAILVATLPMGILQATSTQTDYVLAFWLVGSVSLALTFVCEPTPRAAAWFASSLGLAMLTKGTAYVFAAPLVLALGWWMVTRLKGRVVWPLAPMLLIPMVINAGYFIRNQALFHNPLGPAAENAVVVNANFSPSAIASNVVRDSVLQFGTPSATVNHWLEHGVALVHAQLLHVGLSDPATTFPDAVFHVNPLSLDEDYAGDPIHAVLAIAAVLIVLLAFRRWPRSLLLYAGGLAVAFVLFATYLKWQPWHARLELPLLVLAAPLIAVVLARRAGTVVVAVLAAIVFVASVPWLIDNPSRPLVGFAIPTQPRFLDSGADIFNTPRMDLYFAKNRQLEGIYLRVTENADQMGCREIGLWSTAADWEYPLWVLTERPGTHTRIDSVMVHNDSTRANRFGTRPCVVVALIPGQPASIDVDGVHFVQSWRDGGLSFYTPSPSG